MSKYRKKPIVVDAFKWTGGPDQTEDPVWANESKVITFQNSGTPGVKLLISTLEGTMTADRGDYVIKGIKGEIYPCKPDIFEASYDLVEDESWDH